MNDEYSRGRADRSAHALLDQEKQEQATDRRTQRLARLAVLSEIGGRIAAPAPSAAIKPPVLSTSPVKPATANVPAVSLEDALAAFKAKRAKPPLYSAAQWAERHAKFDAIQAEIDALTQAERRSVYDAAGMHRHSAAPKPLERIRSSGPFTRPLVNPEKELVSPPAPDAAQPARPAVQLDTQHESTVASAPIQRSTAQDEQIISILKSLEYDPLKLPKLRSGTAGVKSEVRNAVGTKGIWSGPTVFNKAWERLTKNADIAYLP